MKYALPPNSDTPPPDTPSPDDGDQEDEDMEALRAKLRASRKERHESVERLKKATGDALAVTPSAGVDTRGIPKRPKEDEDTPIPIDMEAVRKSHEARKASAARFKRTAARETRAAELASNWSVKG